MQLGVSFFPSNSATGRALMVGIGRVFAMLLYLKGAFIYFPLFNLVSSYIFGNITPFVKNIKCWGKSPFSQRPILGPKPGALAIQIHQIFLAIDFNHSTCAVTGFHSIADLEAFLARGLGLGGLGSG